MRWLLLSLALLSFSSSAYATEPCRPLSEQEFSQKVIKPADLVVEGEITDYSTLDHAYGDGWTRIKPKKQMYGKMPESELTIHHWQAVSMPLFNLSKGTTIVAFLKKDGDGYIFTDSDWGDCVPSLIEERRAFVAYTGFMAFTNPGKQWIASEDLEQYILRHHND